MKITVRMGEHRRMLFFIGYFFVAKILLDSQMLMVLLDEVKGFSGIHIGVLEMILLASTLAMELPSGVLTDILGYRNILLLSRLFIMVYSLIMLVGGNWVEVSVGFVCYGISEALRSGTEDTYLYQLTDDTNLLTRANALLQVMGEVGAMLGVLLGGLLVAHHWALLYVLTILLQGGSLLLLWAAEKHPAQSRSRPTANRRDRLGRIVRQIGALCRHSGFLRVAISTILCDAGCSVFVIYYPLFLRGQGIGYLSMALLSLVSIAAGLVFIGVLGRLETQVPNIPLVFTFWGRIGVVVLCAVAVLGGGQRVLYLCCLGILTAITVYIPCGMTLLNTFIPHDSRATANSVVNGVQTFVMMGMIGLYVNYSNETSLPGALLLFIIPGISCLAGTAILCPARSREG